jgi:hypothetical protein
MDNPVFIYYSVVLLSSVKKNPEKVSPFLSLITCEYPESQGQSAIQRKPREPFAQRS